jgi:NAD(P)-dependent dehydrogenase (short-subunit alcohol dehydrogenase family)
LSKNNLFDVSKEIVLVTGVSGQLGIEYANSFLEQGAHVVGLDLISSVESNNLKEKYHNNYHFYIADVTSKVDLEEVLKDIMKKIGSPTVLINNAALDSPPSSSGQESGPFEDYPESSWDKVIDVNLKGVYLCCQIFGAVMARSGKGSIINIASIYGAISPDQNIYEYRRKKGEVFYKPVAYSASKSGVYNLSRYLATYWAKQGVRVNSLTISGVYNKQDEEFLDAYCSRIPVGRMAEVDEYNGAVFFLASSASKYMTGANLVIDGGWTAI